MNRLRYLAYGSNLHPERLDTRAVPYDWYRDLIATGARYLGAPGDYVAAIADHPAIADPDSARVAHHRRLLADLADLPRWRPGP